MKLGVVIPAAGRGRRMGTELNKQFLQLGNRPVLAHTVDLFHNHSAIEDIVIVLRENEIGYCQKEIVDTYKYNKVKTVAGGKTRRQSVYAGLLAFSPAINYVIIHDGARPLLSETVLNMVIEGLIEDDAITVGTDVKNTIKVRSDEDYVQKTLNRNKLVSIQTPQAFKYNLLLKAHKNISAKEKVSDDASLVEKYGHPVKIIKGSYENIKITTPVDLKYAEMILKNRRE